MLKTSIELFTPLDLAEAQDELCHSPDTLGDWIGGLCFQAGQVKQHRRMDDATAEDFAAYSVGALLSLALEQNQPPGTRAAAMDALRDRYLKDSAIHATVLRIASEIAEFRAIDEERVAA